MHTFQSERFMVLVVMMQRRDHNLSTEAPLGKLYIKNYFAVFIRFTYTVEGSDSELCKS